MEKVKVAVIGLGRMGAQPSSRVEGKMPNGWIPITHLEALKEIDHFEIVAICDSDIERLEFYSTLYNIPNKYTDYKILLDCENIELLCIATRTLGRTDIMNYACYAGVKAIYIEKPISRNIEDAKKALCLAEEHGVKIGYGVNRRYHSIYRQVKEIIHSGKYGEIQHIVVEHGRKTLMWTHPHAIDIILFFANTTDVEYVSGQCSFQDGGSITQEVNLIDDDPIVEQAFIKFKNGLSGSINQVGGNNVRIALSKGIVTIYSDASYVEIKKAAENTPFYFTETELLQIPSSIESATVGILRDLGSNKTQITNHEILVGQKILMGIISSTIFNKNRITLEEIPMGFTVTGKTGVFFA